MKLDQHPVMIMWMIMNEMWMMRKKVKTM